MVVRLRVSRQQANELAIIRDTEPDQLKVALAELRALDSSRKPDDLSDAMLPFVSIRELYELINRGLESTKAAGALTRQLAAVSITRRQHHLNPEEVINELTRALEADLWNEQEMEQWRHTAPIFQAMLSLEMVNITAKSLDLSYDYTNIFESAYILTDIRPVFDDEHTRLAGAIISQLLRIVYSSDNERISLTIAMNEKDIKRLQGSCAEALKKLDVSRKRLAQFELKSILPGEDISVFYDI